LLSELTIRLDKWQRPDPNLLRMFVCNAGLTGRWFGPDDRTSSSEQVSRASLHVDTMIQ